MATEEQRQKIQEIIDRAYNNSISQEQAEKELSESCDEHSETFNEIKDYFTELYNKNGTDSDGDVDSDSDGDVDGDSDGDVDRDCSRVPEMQKRSLEYELDEGRSM